MLREKAISRKSHGFTLIEMIIAIIISGILVVLFGTIQTTSANIWIRGNTKVLLQSESSFALNYIARTARGATGASVLNSGQVDQK